MAKKPVAIKILPGLRQHLVPIDSVQPDTRNPRKLKSKGMRAMKKSLRKIGVHRLAVVNEHSKLIIIGHQMWAALKELGQTEIPVLWTDETDAESVTRNILDNLAGEKVAGWDYDMRAALLDEFDIDLDDYSMGEPDERESENKGQASYVVEVTLTSEADQDKLMAELEAEGYQCKAKTSR